MNHAIFAELTADGMVVVIAAAVLGAMQLLTAILNHISSEAKLSRLSEIDKSLLAVKITTNGLSKQVIDATEQRATAVATMTERDRQAAESKKTLDVAFELASQTLSTAQKLRDTTLANAKIEADELVSNAKLVADKLVADKLVADKLVADKLVADKLEA